MFDIQIHTILSGTVPKLLQPVAVVRVNSVENQIERRIRLSCEAQNFVGFIRPNELTTVHLPSEGPRVTQSLSLCKILPSSLQIGLGGF